jgi:hypothetical protein
VLRGRADYCGVELLEHGVEVTAACKQGVALFAQAPEQALQLRAVAGGRVVHLDDLAALFERVARSACPAG